MIVSSYEMAHQNTRFICCCSATLLHASTPSNVCVKQTSTLENSHRNADGIQPSVIKMVLIQIITQTAVLLASTSRAPHRFVLWGERKKKTTLVQIMGRNETKRRETSSDEENGGRQTAPGWLSETSCPFVTIVNQIVCLRTRQSCHSDLHRRRKLLEQISPELSKHFLDFLIVCQSANRVQWRGSKTRWG